MLFKKKKQTESRRVRRSETGTGAAQPVFSYHARSGRTEPAAGTRRTVTRLLWAADSKKSPSPRPNRRSLPKRIVVIFGLILLAALVINSLFLSRDPRIAPVAETEGQQIMLRDQNVYYEAARSILADSLVNTNKLTIDTKRIARAMEDKFPELEHVSVVLPVIGRQPALYVQPVEPSLLLKSSGGEIFVIDPEGRAVLNVSQTPNIGKLKLVVVDDQSGLPITLGRSALPSDDVAFITEVIGQLKAKKVAVAGMVLPAGASELDLRVEGASYIVKFNLHGDARAEVGTFLGVKQHLERGNITPSSYIDVRVDKRAYYR